MSGIVVTNNKELLTHVGGLHLDNRSLYLISEDSGSLLLIDDIDVIENITEDPESLALCVLYTLGVSHKELPELIGLLMNSKTALLRFACEFGDGTLTLTDLTKAFTSVVSKFMNVTDDVDLSDLEIIASQDSINLYLNRFSAEVLATVDDINFFKWEDNNFKSKFKGWTLNTTYAEVMYYSSIAITNGLSELFDNSEDRELASLIKQLKEIPRTLIEYLEGTSVMSVPVKDITQVKPKSIKNTNIFGRVR